MRTTILTALLGALPTTLSSPVQPPITNSSALPVNFGLVVYPGFQALDVFGPLDVLNMVSMTYKNDTTMHLDIIAKTLASGSTQQTPTPGSWGESIVVTNTFDDVIASKKEYDVVIVPGGVGTRTGMDEEIAFVKAIFPKTKHFLTVCTGSTIAARAGVLDGRKATTNKKSWGWAITTGKDVEWVHKARWVQDGNVWTSSGVSAGIDLLFAWVGSVYGEAVAAYVADSMEYEKTVNATDDPFAGIWS